MGFDIISVNPFLSHFSPLNQVVYLFDKMRQGLLLLRKLLLDSIEVRHQLVELFIVLLVFGVGSRVKDTELLLEIPFRIWLIFLLLVDLEEIAELGTLFALSYVNDDSHDDVFESVLSSDFFLLMLSEARA